MNASKFMDKQIMDLSRSQSTDLINSTTKNTDDFLDLMNPQSEEDSDGGSSSLKKKKDEILPNYDFHPIPRPNAGIPSSLSSSSDAPAASAATTTSPRAASRGWNSADSKPNSSHLRSYGSLDPVEPEKVVMEKDQKLNDSAILSEIDRAMKKHSDSLLHAIDGLSARLSQLENRTRQLEYSLDDLKVSVGNNHGSTDGKMRHLENILLEVQSGVQDIKDKQEVMEGHMHLAKLQISKVEKQSETPNSTHTEPSLQSSVSPPQQHQLQQFPIAAPQPVPSLPPNAPPHLQQNIQPAPPMTSQFHPTQISAIPQRDSYFLPSGQIQEAPSQQYQIPTPAHPQQQNPTPTPPSSQPQQYQSAPTPPYSQPPPPPPPQQQQQHPPGALANAPPQYQPPMGHHHPEENPYPPAPSYPPNLRPPTSQSSSGVPHSQPYYGGPSSMYEAPSSSRSGFSSGYPPPSGGPTEPYPYSAPPSHYGGGPSVKPQPHSPGSVSSNYFKIPTARILPQAIPTATRVSDGASSGGSGNKVPVDDVIDKVASMGFPREHVRAIVRRLTESKQEVDLNAVLDKLMNDGDMQLQSGWSDR